MSDVWKVEESDGIVIAAHDNPPMNYFVGASDRGPGGDAAALARARRAGGRSSPAPPPAATSPTTRSRSWSTWPADREELIRRSYDLIFGWHSLLQSLSYLDKPIIAAMTGDTGGGGLELSLNCDIRIMERGDYMCGFPEASLGILTGTGSQLLSGRSAAAGRSTSSCARRYVSPEGALELGIVNELADDAKARAIEVAEGLAHQVGRRPHRGEALRSSAAPTCRCRRACGSRRRSG